jgi:hypothetical protein
VFGPDSVEIAINVRRGFVGVAFALVSIGGHGRGEIERRGLLVGTPDLRDQGRHLSASRDGRAEVSRHSQGFHQSQRLFGGNPSVSVVLVRQRHYGIGWG